MRLEGDAGDNEEVMKGSWMKRMKRRKRFATDQLA